MAFILTADQEVPVTVAFDDDHGNPAVVDGVPVWASSDDTILMVVAADDGMSAVVSAVGPDGTGQISVTADADMGSGVVSVIGLLDMEVVAGAAAVAVISAGTPVPHVVPVP